ncbi:MAG TPA: hypothetical protein VGD13_09665 [Xanthobacteraceae bacterium]
MSMRGSGVRHARPCAGHPRFASFMQQDVDGRVKPGHDERKLVKYAEIVCESARFGFDAKGRADYVERL